VELKDAETVPQELLETVDEPVAGILMVCAEGLLSPVELSDPVPLRDPLLLEQPLPDTDTVCVTEREVAGLRVAVAKLEVLVDTEADAV
jgi:hypothetical protein